MAKRLADIKAQAPVRRYAEAIDAHLDHAVLPELSFSESRVPGAEFPRAE